MPVIVAAIVIVVLLSVGYLLWRSHKQKQAEVWRIERKVTGGRDLILRSDIDLLMRVKSPLLVQAIELRRQQTGEHGHPESED